MKLFPYAGSKKKHCGLICGIIRHETSKLPYAEPMFGSGAVFFELMPPRSYISDINPMIVNLIWHVKEMPYLLCEHLEKIEPTEDNFSKIANGMRTRTDWGAWSAAATFFILWTCYNGVIRSYADGTIKMYPGTRLSTWKRDLPRYIDIIDAASDALSNAKIAQADVLDMPPGHMAFIDPPWIDSEANYGVEFNHSALAEFLVTYNGKWLLTINDREGAGVYRDASEWEMHLTPYYSVSPNPDGRGERGELLFANFRPKLFLKRGYNGSTGDHRNRNRNIWPRMVD